MRFSKTIETVIDQRFQCHFLFWAKNTFPKEVFFIRISFSLICDFIYQQNENDTQKRSNKS